MTISFRLIAMFSSALARLAFSSSPRSLFANLSFLVRSGPIYTSRVLSCRVNALLRLIWTDIGELYLFYVSEIIIIIIRCRLL